MGWQCIYSPGNYQYHLRFTPSGVVTRQILGVVMCPGHASLRRAEVDTERSKDAEVARIGHDLVMVNQGDVMAYEDVPTDALALFVLQCRRYELQDEGIRC